VDFQQCVAQWQWRYVIALITCVLVTRPAVSPYQSRLECRTLTYANTDHASTTKAARKW